MEQTRILDIMVSTLRAYLTNKNTGNVYEIATILWIGRRMGLTPESYSQMEPYVANIARYNNKATDKINAAYARLKTAATGTGFTIDGHQVTDLQNATQDDSVGTGDIIAICADGSRKTISICDAYSATPGDRRKCLKNPSCKGFGCGTAEVAAFKDIAAAARQAYVAEMTARFGADQTAWKRKPSEAAVVACSQVAAKTAEIFNALPLEERRERLNVLLHTKLSGTPADYLAMVRSDWTPVFYKWDVAEQTAESEPTLKANGIYLYVHMGPDVNPIAQIQVKFNNGVKSAIHSSWNAVVHLDRVFRLADARIT